MPPTSRAFFCLAAAASLVISSGCAPRRPTDAGGPPEPRRGPAVGTLQMSAVYRQNGMLVAPEPMPFIGTVRYLAGATLDSTLVLVTLSFANQNLTFASEGAVRRGNYSIATQLRREGNALVRASARETVRVGSFREAARPDESVVFQQFFAAPPGRYDLVVAIRDEGSARNSTAELSVTVPSFAGSTLSTPIPVFEGNPRETRDSIPSIIANPRATAVLGRDTVLPLYLEAYNLSEIGRVELTALDDRNRSVWRDTVSIGEGSVAGVVAPVPVARVGVGRHTITASLLGTSAPSVASPVFISFGEGVAIGSFDEMLSYLRFFTSPERLQPLRDTMPDRRARAWAEFLRETDPDPSTPEHEGLRAYFQRIQLANERFRDDSPGGWLSDRGKVFVTLGEPDQILQSPDMQNRRGRSQAWLYSRFQVQLVFVDRTGFGRWELTPNSEFDFQNVVRRERARQTEAQPLGR